MTDSEILEGLADRYVKIIMSKKDEKMKSLLLYTYSTYGTKYAVSLTPNSEHNFQKAIDSIYKYKKNNPDSNIDLLLERGWEKIANTEIDNKRALDGFLNSLDYIAYKQRKNEATFYLDVEKYLRVQKDVLTDLSKRKGLGELLNWYITQSNIVLGHTKESPVYHATLRWGP